MSTEKTCADRVGPAWERVRDNLAFYMKHGISAEDFHDNREFPDKPETDTYDDQADFQDDDDAYRAEQEIADEFENVSDFHSYALSCDYVEPETFDDQREGYWRYQISWGGPSTEIRFYASPYVRTVGVNGSTGFKMHRAEFWFLDWFDGSSVNVTSSDEAQWLFDWFEDIGSVQGALDEATA